MKRYPHVTGDRAIPISNHFRDGTGASIGDYLSQAQSDGGLGLGTTVTSFIFLGAILALVIYLTLTREDEISAGTVKKDLEEQHREHVNV